MDDKEKVLIIGAGPAGLSAAYQLVKDGHKLPVIYEMSGDIGGLSKSVDFNGNSMDIGPHRFFTKNKQVNDLWEEVLPLQGKPALDDIRLGRISKKYSPGGPDPEKKDKVMLVRDRITRIFFLRKFFDYPISLKPQTFANMGLRRTFKAGVGYLLAVIHKRKVSSLEDFYINRFGKPLYEMFFEDYTEKLWGVHPSGIAPDWGAQRVKGVSITAVILDALKRPFRKKKDAGETSLIEQFVYPKLGSGQLYESMAEEILKAGGEIHFHKKVTQLYSDGQRITGAGITDMETGTVGHIHCSDAISSMPIKDLVKAMREGGISVPGSTYAAATQLPYRDIIVVGLLLKNLKIKNTTEIRTIMDVIPDVWIYVQERDVRIGRMEVYNNWSPYIMKNWDGEVMLGVEYFCSEGDDLWSKTEQEFIQFTIDELAHIDLIEKDKVISAIQIKERKAYPAYFGTYQEFDKVKAFLDTFRNLYCIGRNGQHRYNNMDHSILTGLRAAEAIRDGKGKEAIWDVNTEEEYLEEKKEG